MIEAMNKAAKYGVGIHAAPFGAAWRAVEVRHLTPEENKGRHAVYVDVIDETGREYSQAERFQYSIGWKWDGGPDVAPKPLDKPDTPLEQGHGNIDLYEHQTMSVWIVGDLMASDRVVGFHVRHPDELGPNGEIWNSRGHHSFYVKFQRMVDVEPVQPPATADLAAQVARNTADIKRLMAWAVSFDGEM
jgi:hypothetical protein